MARRFSDKHLEKVRRLLREALSCIEMDRYKIQGDGQPKKLRPYIPTGKIVKVHHRVADALEIIQVYWDQVLEERRVRKEKEKKGE